MWLLHRQFGYEMLTIKCPLKMFFDNEAAVKYSISMPLNTRKRCVHLSKTRHQTTYPATVSIQEQIHCTPACKINGNVYFLQFSRPAQLIVVKHKSTSHSLPSRSLTHRPQNRFQTPKIPMKSSRYKHHKFAKDHLLKQTNKSKHHMYEKDVKEDTIMQLLAWCQRSATTPTTHYMLSTSD